jgi:hypothetical protein
MGNRVAAGWALADPTGPCARPGAAHASPACARPLSSRPCSISSRHLFHLLPKTPAREGLLYEGHISTLLDPTRASTRPTASSAQITRSSPALDAGEASIVLSAMDVPTPTIRADHLCARATNAMGHLKPISTIVTSETTHSQHLLSWRYHFLYDVMVSNLTPGPFTCLKVAPWLMRRNTNSISTTMVPEITSTP